MAKLTLMFFWCALAGTTLGWSQDAHASENDHDDHEASEVRLSAEQLKRLNLGEIRVRKGEMNDARQFPGEVQFDPMRVAHLVPRVNGIVRKVNKRLGDQVQGGQVLALLDSRDLSNAKSKYLAAVARQKLHEKTYLREKRLWERQISAEQEFLQAEQVYEESRIQVRRERATLIALGLSDTHIVNLENQPNLDFSSYAMRMPFDGTIIEQHISLGEFLRGDRSAYLIADTSTMWVMAAIPESELNQMRLGQKAVITLKSMPEMPIEATLDYLSPQLDAETRSAQARFILPNPKGQLRAGMFGNITIFFQSQVVESDRFLVPQTALQRSEEGHVVFKKIATGHYQMLAVKRLRQSGEFAEVQGQLEEGDSLATGDIFLLKSQLGKGNMSQGHNH